MNDSTRSFILTAFVTIALVFITGEADAENLLQPALMLSEEYNDNIRLTPNDPAHGLVPVTDYITRVIPSINLVYKAPLWDWNVAYAYDYRYYAKKTVAGDSTHTLNLVNHTRILKEFFFLDVNDNYLRVSTDVLHDYTQQSIFVNQSDTNVLTVKPYLTFNLSSRMTATAGYQYRNVWYKDPALIDRVDHSTFADINEELSPRTIMTASVKYTYGLNKILDYNRTDISAGPRYEYAEGSTLWFIIGNTLLHSAQWGSVNQTFWDAGISHKFRTYTLSFNTALTYLDSNPTVANPASILTREDRFVGTFNKTTDRFTLGLTAGLWEYRYVPSKHLQNSRYSTGGSIAYNITPALKGTYSLTVDRYEDNQNNTFSMLYLNGVRFDYLVAERTTLALDYRNTHGYSPDAINYGMNYDNNRIMVELKKQF